MALHAEELAERLTGVVAFPITPFRRDESLDVDWDAFRVHVDFLAGAGVSALVVAGGTGEFYSLRAEEVIALARAAVKVAARRLPVLVAVGGVAAEARRAARAVAATGADGALVMPPAYATPDPEALAEYYRAVAAAAPDLGLAVYFRDHVALEVATLRRLAQLPNVVAVKDGRGQIRDFVLARFTLGDRFRWLGGFGDDVLAAYAAAGADGYTSSIACFDPALALRLWELAGGRIADLDALLASRVLPWFELRRRRRGYEVAVVKAAVEAFGATAGPVRPPLANLSDDDRAEVVALARRVGRLTT